MDEKDNGMWPLSRGKANVHELIGVLAVRKTKIRVGRFLFQNGFALHGKQYRTAARSGHILLRSNLAAKHAVDKHKVTDGQQHAEAPPDQAVSE